MAAKTGQRTAIGQVFARAILVYADDRPAVDSIVGEFRMIAAGHYGKPRGRGLQNRKLHSVGLRHIQAKPDRNFDLTPPRRSY